ncbi:hypothetical protein FHS96_005406 [Sphingomonas zeicaulis]|uniref:hypothetical protein n=1 Tax=Sphingomonas zeicaulis TaxID=1632740 RepID=UPI003D1FE79B
MRFASYILAGAALLAAIPTMAASPKASARGETKLAQALEGRTPGKPVRCINLRDIRSSTIYDGTAIVYRANGNTLYVNRPKIGAASLDQNDVLVTKTFSTQLCNIDTIQLFDVNARMQTGFVGLGDFVPYAKPAKTASR